jgi:hypothetical protein
MTLCRQEYEMRRPKNWGKITYEAIQRRTEELKSSKILAPKPSVQAALENNPVITGKLDLSGVFVTLSESEQCQFLSQYTKCESISLTGWTSISGKVLRSISICMGESLTSVDLSNSYLEAIELEILMAHSSKIKIMKLNNCPNLDSSCMQVIAKLASTTVTELDVSNCQLFRIEPLLCIGGCVGVDTHSLYRLVSLNLAGCPVQDVGLNGIAHGCKKLRYLNLEDCSDLTDNSIITVTQACKNLQLLNLCGLQKLTNKSVRSIAKHCPKLYSLNLMKIASVTDDAMQELARGCPKLQALNLVGLQHLTEMTMYEVSQHCPGILMLNMSGCPNITVNGLKAVVQGLKYVQMSHSFVGFLPIDTHIEQKLTNHVHHIRDSAIEHIATGLKQRAKKKAMKEKHVDKIRNRAASTIQAYMFRYCRRMRFYALWRQRVRNASAMMIQKFARGKLARNLFKCLQHELALFLLNTPYALRIQKVVRGHLSRTRSEAIFVLLREMYIGRRREAYTAVTTRLQAVARRYLATKRVKAWREVRHRRMWDEKNSATLIQKLARKFISIIRVQGMRFAKQRKDEREYRAARLIQKFYTQAMQRYLNKLDGKEILKVQHKRVKATLLLQRVVRGFFGREYAYREKIFEATRHKAAIMIQTAFRCQRVLRWKDIRNNSIAAFVLDRHYLERMTSLERSRLRYHNYVIENRRDSASDPDDEFKDPIWVEMYDNKRKRAYWVSETTNEITYDEPRLPVAHEKSMIGLRVRIFWVVQGAWYEGTITKFHRRTHRHRIDYDDTDHEWIDFDTEYERVQIQSETGSWMMYLTFTSEGRSDDNRRIQQIVDAEQLRKQAYIDAAQWEMVKDDYSGGAVYMSNLNGEIRIGSQGSEHWVIQDDGFGGPCFYNTHSGETEYEDPRFMHDTDAEMLSKRAYVMEELRFSLYFCREFWERYERACLNNDEKEKRIIYLQVYQSNKPKHLNAWVLRAKALFVPTSVIDVPMNVTEKQELEYSTWIVGRMHELAEKGQALLVNKKEIKSKVITEITGKAKKTITCHYCGREAKRNLGKCNWSFCS